ncbi:MAG: hypothetical protein K2K59_07275 [Muribaculaceae bacterium]|nr:hypothetical protein [Muribaculaceae bacterium]
MINKLPEEFVARILGDSTIPDPQGLLDELASGNPCVAIRHNRLKGSRPADGADLVPWCNRGEYLAERPQFTFDPHLHQGLYYVQDASSMALAAVIESLGLDRPVQYLDCCAAPGGKTTAAIDALPAGSFIVANEAEPARAAALDENLMRWGYPDVAITVGPAQRLGRLPEGCFDVIGADVPCSGEGMMRKDPKAIEQWNPGLVESCARLQRDILSAVWPLLRPGGYMIYSTCTFAAAEDENQVRWLADEFGAEVMELPPMPGVVNGHFFPHLVRGEGLFMALLRKPGDSVRPARRLTEKDLAKVTKLLRYGSIDTEPKGRDVIPSHAAAQRYDFDASKWPQAEVDRPAALQFLHRDAITLPAGTPRGLTLLTYDGRPLGWVNNLGSRANNLLPRNLRILSR